MLAALAQRATPGREWIEEMCGTAHRLDGSRGSVAVATCRSAIRCW